MSVKFLREIAAMPLPKSFSDPRDINAIKILRQAGLVLASVDDGPPESTARVLAVTDKGRSELLRFHYPDEFPMQSRSRGNWLQVVAQRAREAVGTSGRRDRP